MRTWKKEAAYSGFPWAAAKTRDFRDLSNINIIPKHAMTKVYCVELDVHKETIAIAYATGETREDSVYHGPSINQWGQSKPINNT